MNLITIISYRNDIEGLINVLRTMNLLKTIVYCDGCNNILKLVKYKRNIDKSAFRCYKKDCRFFLKYISLRKHSFFGNFKISLIDVLLILYYKFHFKNQVELYKDFGIDKNVVKKVNRNLLDIYERKMAENPICLGGEGNIVQIDESMFHYKQKYHVGRISQSDRWVFGMIDTSTTPHKYIIKVVPNRRAITLLPIIRSKCRAGSIIWSDEWPAYQRLNETYNHETVNHKLFFVNPETGTHTQNIESLWAKLKDRLRKKKGVGTGSLDQMLLEWSFIDNYAQNFETFLSNLI